MKCRIIVPFLASLALCASAAMAQDAPKAPPAPIAGQMGHGHWHMNRADMEKFHAQMCTDHYARAVGKLAYLETKLALTDTQKPLFERWKRVSLSSAKALSDECGTMTPPAEGASIVDRLKLHEKMMKARLADLDAQMPALEALVASLSDEQKRVFDHHGMFEEGGMHGMGGMMEHWHHHHDGGRDNDNDAPPPPPAN
ncbi:MAG: Spy/CpxP family protein refolding chaperone [Rhizomicrobium sp.]|jgi:hypothetical protein